MYSTGWFFKCHCHLLPNCWADVGGEDALQKEGVEQGQKGGGDCDGQEEVETHRQGGIQQQRQGDRRGQVGDGQLGAVGEEAAHTEFKLGEDGEE